MLDAAVVTTARDSTIDDKNGANGNASFRQALLRLIDGCL